MTKGAAFLLALGLAAAALLHTGIWEYGDGFIFNRFSGDIIYVDLPEDADLTHVHDRADVLGRTVGLHRHGRVTSGRVASASETSHRIALVATDVFAPSASRP